MSKDSFIFIIIVKSFSRPVSVGREIYSCYLHIIHVYRIQVSSFFTGHNSSYISFSGEGKDSELRMFDNNDERRVGVPLLAKNAKVDQGWTIECRGKEIPFSSSLFRIQRSSDGAPFYTLKVRTNPCQSLYLCSHQCEAPGWGWRGAQTQGY